MDEYLKVERIARHKALQFFFRAEFELLVTNERKAVAKKRRF